MGKAEETRAERIVRECYEREYRQHPPECGCARCNPPDIVQIQKEAWKLINASRAPWIREAQGGGQ